MVTIYFYSYCNINNTYLQFKNMFVRYILIDNIKRGLIKIFPNFEIIILFM